MTGERKYMLKILGSCMIFLGILGIGYTYIEREEKIIHVIEMWEYIMHMFISEITYKKQPLSLACHVIGEKIGKEEGKCLKRVAERMKNKKGDGFWKVWEEECQAYIKKEKIIEELQPIIKGFGVLTGFEDVEIQEKLMIEQQEKWKNLRVRKQKEHQERKRLIWILSSCMGLMLVLILW